MKITMGQNRAARQEPRKSRFATSKSPVLRPWLIILNPMGLSNERFSHSPVSHAITCGGSGHPLPRRGDGCIGRNPHFHHRQPGRRLRRRPMPRQGRTLRRISCTLVLPITGFCAGLFLPACRCRRDHRFGSQDQRQLPARQLRRIRRDYLPTLRPSATAAADLPHPRRGNDAPLPKPAAMVYRSVS